MMERDSLDDFRIFNSKLKDEKVNKEWKGEEKL